MVKRKSYLTFVAIVLSLAIALTIFMFKQSKGYVRAGDRVTDLKNTTWRWHDTLTFDNWKKTNNVDAFPGLITISIGMYREDPDSIYEINGEFYNGDVVDTLVECDRLLVIGSVLCTGGGILNLDSNITFTGGNDATNADLINWMYENADLVTDTPGPVLPATGIALQNNTFLFIGGTAIGLVLIGGAVLIAKKKKVLD